MGEELQGALVVEVLIEGRPQGEGIHRQDAAAVHAHQQGPPGGDALKTLHAGSEVGAEHRSEHIGHPPDERVVHFGGLRQGRPDV